MPDRPSPENPDPFITKEFRKDVLSNLWMSPRLDLEAAIGRLIASAKAATESDKKDGKDGAADGVPGIRMDRNIEQNDDDDSDGSDGPDDGPDTGRESTDDTGKETSDGTGKESTDDTGKEASDDTGKESTDDTGKEMEMETSHVKTFEEDVNNIHRVVNDPDFSRALQNLKDKVINAKDTLEAVLDGVRRLEFDESENDTPSASSLDQQKLDDLERQFDVRLKELIRTKRRII
jgi:hypothetical protein